MRTGDTRGARRRGRRSRGTRAGAFVRALAAGLATLAPLAGCGEHTFEPPDRERQVAQADSMFDDARFDTVTWANDSVRQLQGNLVFSSTCRNCHGSEGGGETAYASSRGLDVPSLVAPDWRLAGDLDGVRRRIYTGHAAGMPSLGVDRLTEREVDAAAAYVLYQLRPEVLGRP